MADLDKGTAVEDQGTAAAQPAPDDKGTATAAASATEPEKPAAAEPAPTVEQEHGSGDAPDSLDDIETMVPEGFEDEGSEGAAPAGEEKPAAAAAAEGAEAGEEKGTGRASDRIRNLVKERNTATDELTKTQEENQRLKDELAGKGKKPTLPEGTELLDFTTLDPSNLPESLNFEEAAPVADDFIGDDGDVDETKYEVAKTQYVEKLKRAVDTHNDGVESAAVGVNERTEAAQRQAESSKQTIDAHLDREKTHISALDEAGKDGKDAYLKSTETFRETASKYLQKFEDPVTKEVVLHDPSGVIDAVVGSEISPELAAYLGDNPDIHASLHQMSPANSIRTIRDIEIEIKTEKGLGKMPNVTAPDTGSAPPNAGGGGVGGAKKGLGDIAEEGSMDDYMSAAGYDNSKWPE